MSDYDSDTEKTAKSIRKSFGDEEQPDAVDEDNKTKKKALKKYMGDKGVPPPMAPEDIDNAAAQLQGTPPPNPGPIQRAQQRAAMEATQDPRTQQEQAYAMRMQQEAAQQAPQYIQAAHDVQAPEDQRVGQMEIQNQMNHNASDKQKALSMWLKQNSWRGKAAQGE